MSVAASRTPTLAATPTTATARNLATTLTQTIMLPFLSGGTQITSTAQITTGLGAEIDIDPAVGGQLSVENGAFVIQMPAGAITSTHRLMFQRLKPDRERDAKAQLLLAAFSLRALDIKTGKETTQFSKPVTIQVRYDPNWIQGWRASALTLAYWDPKRQDWVPVASTVDATRDTVTAQTLHFTDYGLVAGPNIQPYLPNVQSAEPNLFLGASSASYGFELPPGRNGLVPKLSLSYSSSGVDMMDPYRSSFVGTGWSLSTSYIARDLRSTLGSADDVFSLVMNGSGYDLVLGTDGYYHTSQEQYWRISFDTANNRWLVVTNDGTQYQYGYSNNSRALQYLRDADPRHTYPVTYAWWLETVVDTHSNQIKYTYQHDVGSVSCYSADNFGGLPVPESFDNGLYPQTIEYNWGTSSFLTRIEFAYSGRNDIMAVGTTLQCAVPEQNWKLDHIYVRTTDNANTMQLVRQYDLNYDYSLFPGYLSYVYCSGLPCRGRLTLSTIKQIGSDGYTPLTTYTATYSGNRLWIVNNGVGGATSYAYDYYYFNDSNSPTRFWAWNHTSLEAGSISPVACTDHSWCMSSNGSGYVALRSPNYSPGAVHRVVAFINDNIEQSCRVKPAVWDGRTEAILQDWWSAPDWNSNASAIGGLFTLAHDALTMEFRLYIDGSCQFWSGDETLYRTYYRVANRTVNDGQGNLATTTYAYEGPQLNYANTISTAAGSGNPRVPAATQFRGHSKVTVTDPTGAKTEYYYYQDDVYLGRVSQTYQKDGGGVTYTRTQNDFTARSIGVQPQCTSGSSGCDAPVTGDVSNYVYTSQTTRETWDGQSSPKTVWTAYEPDAYGNIAQTKESSEFSQYRTTTQTFYPNTTKWIVNKVGVTQVLDSTGSRISETRNFYDGQASYTATPTAGDVTRVDVAVDQTRFITQSRTTYDGYGNPTSVTDALSHATTTTYDSTYNLFPTNVRNAVGQVITNTFKYQWGKILTTTDPNNVTTEYAYDVFGRTASIWAPLDRGFGATAKYDYTLGSPRSMVHVQVRNDLGGANTATFQQAWSYYDGLGRIIQQQSTGLNGTLILVNTAYNSRGQTWAVSNPYAVAGTGGTYQTPNWAVQPYTEHLYDPVGRETTTKNPDGTSRTYGYLQWTTTITDENSHVIQKVADFLGRTEKVLEFNQGQTYTTSYTYNTLDQLQIITNNSGNFIVTNYDWLGRKKDMQDPDLGPTPKAWTYGYDDAGNLTSQTDARGCTTTLIYDALNRVTRKTYSGPGACGLGTSVTYGYDAFDGTSQFGRGRRTSMSDSSGTTTTWKYDKQGRLTSQTNTISGAPDTYTTSWTYDAMDRARSMTYPDSETVNLTYNEQTLVKSVTSSLTNYVTGSGYNAANELTSLAMGNGETTSYTYDPKNLRLKTLQTVGASTLQNLQYAYDPVGNVKTITDILHSNEVSTFGYDDLDRLISVNVTGGPSPYTASWVYNPIGNITQSTKNGLQTNYTYDTTRVHAVKQVGTQTLTYDPNGNVANRGGDVLIYDEENRLQRDTGANGTTTVYAYNGDGQHVKREVIQGNNRTFTFYVGNWLEVQTVTTATPTPTNTPRPTNTPTRTLTPTRTPTPAVVGSGSMQTVSDFAVGTTLWQAYWRGDQGWSRTVPIVNGAVQWGSASAWSGPLAINGFPGSGALQAQGDYVFGNTLFQDYWRGDQRWSRTVPIVNNVIQWGSASAWSGPTGISVLPGSGTLQGESNFVVGNTLWQAIWRNNQGWARTVPIVNGVIQWGSASTWELTGTVASLINSGGYWCWLSTSNGGGWDGSAASHATPVASNTERGGDCAPSRAELASPARALSGTVTKYYYFGSQRVAMRTASGVAYLYGDHLGSTSVTANSSGTQTAQQTYYAYGTVRTTSGTLPTDYTFTGQKLDASAGLMYYGARYYDAAIGRFAQPDSLIPSLYNPQSLNRYSYTLNNPVRYTDPTGHRVCEDEECNDTEPDVPIEQVVQTEGNFSSDEEADVTTVLNNFSDTLGQDRFDQLIGDAVRGANHANRKLTLRRVRGTGNGPGWFDREGRIDLTDATFDPRGFPNYYYAITTQADSAKLLIGHELAHVIVDGLRREAGIDLAVLYQNNVTVSPIHGGAAPNEDLATAISIGVLTEHGIQLNQPARYTDEISRFVRTQALPYLRQGGLIGP